MKLNRQVLLFKHSHAVHILYTRRCHTRLMRTQRHSYQRQTGCHGEGSESNYLNIMINRLHFKSKQCCFCLLFDVSPFHSKRSYAGTALNANHAVVEDLLYTSRTSKSNKYCKQYCRQSVYVVYCELCVYIRNACTSESVTLFSTQSLKKKNYICTYMICQKGQKSPEETLVPKT